MKIFDKLPAASPRIGFFKAVATWKDAALVEFGPEGTMHYAQGVIRGETSNLYTTGMKERQIIFGDTDNLESAIRDIDRDAGPKLLFVTSSPVSEIIGTDLKMIACRQQPLVRAKISVWDNVPMEGTEPQGYRAACEKAAEYLRQTVGETTGIAEVEKCGFLILGLNEADWNGVADLGEIRRMMEHYFGIPCLNDEDGRYCLHDLRMARWILCATPEAVSLAEVAHSLWGIPWHQGLPYGIGGCEKMVAAFERATGQRADRRWNEECRELKRAIAQFREKLGSLDCQRIFLDARSARCDSWATFLTRELGFDVAHPAADSAALSTDGAVGDLSEIQEGDILLGSGLLCAMYPEHKSLCIEYPVVNQKLFSRHIPLMGVWGAENFISLLYACLL